MSHRSWMILAVLIGLAIVANLLLGWNLHIFLGRKLAGAIDWMAFWR